VPEQKKNTRRSVRDGISVNRVYRGLVSQKYGSGYYLDYTAQGAGTFEFGESCFPFAMPTISLRIVLLSLSIQFSCIMRLSFSHSQRSVQIAPRRPLLFVALVHWTAALAAHVESELATEGWSIDAMFGCHRAQGRN
jgi:hypothetical protein